MSRTYKRSNNLNISALVFTQYKLFSQGGRNVSFLINLLYFLCPLHYKHITSSYHIKISQSSKPYDASDFKRAIAAPRRAARHSSSSANIRGQVSLPSRRSRGVLHMGNRGRTETATLPPCDPNINK